MFFKDMEADAKESSEVILNWTLQTMWECELIMAVADLMEKSIVDDWVFSCINE